MTLRDMLASLVRTVVPYAAGVGIAWVARKTGLDLPTGTFEAAAEVAAAAVYYAAVRALEARWAWIGWLLGFPVAPTYAKKED